MGAVLSKFWSDIVRALGFRLVPTSSSTSQNASHDDASAEVLDESGAEWMDAESSSQDELIEKDKSIASPSEDLLENPLSNESFRTPEKMTDAQTVPPASPLKSNWEDGSERPNPPLEKGVIPPNKKTKMEEEVRQKPGRTEDKIHFEAVPNVHFGDMHESFRPDSSPPEYKSSDKFNQGIIEPQEMESSKVEDEEYTTPTEVGTMETPNDVELGQEINQVGSKTSVDDEPAFSSKIDDPEMEEEVLDSPAVKMSVEEPGKLDAAEVDIGNEEEPMLVSSGVADETAGIEKNKDPELDLDSRMQESEEKPSGSDDIQRLEEGPAIIPQELEADTNSRMTEGPELEDDMASNAREQDAMASGDTASLGFKNLLSSTEELHKIEHSSALTSNIDAFAGGEGASTRAEVVDLEEEREDEIDATSIRMTREPDSVPGDENGEAPPVQAADVTGNDMMLTRQNSVPEIIISSAHHEETEPQLTENTEAMDDVTSETPDPSSGATILEGDKTPHEDMAEMQPGACDKFENPVQDDIVAETAASESADSVMHDEDTEKSAVGVLGEKGCNENVIFKEKSANDNASSSKEISEPEELFDTNVENIDPNRSDTGSKLILENSGKTQVHVQWSGHAHNVLVTGSWVNWAQQIALQKSSDDVWSADLVVDKGLKDVEMKFIVDDVWMLSPDMEWKENSEGIRNNYVKLVH